MEKEDLGDRLLLGVVLAGGAALTIASLVYAPSFTGRAGFTAPLSWKLFFFHVPVALASFLAFSVALVRSLQYLAGREERRDHQAHAAVEVGVLLAGLTLATGMIWGKAEWGVPWRWDDAKLVVVLLMFLIYAAYLFLRQQVPEPELRARVSALYAIVGFVSVPLSWVAQRIWLSFHPTVFGSENPDAGVVTPGVLPIFLLGLLVFFLTFAYLYRWRTRNLMLEARIERLETAEVIP